MMGKVLVLGCGPAGLLAAHAANQEGHAVTIISKKTPSYIAGAQFLHTAIPDLTPDEPDGTIKFVHKGTEEGYARKIYGDPKAKTSWGAYFGPSRPVWNLRKWYPILWDMYEHRITDGLWLPLLLDNACKDFDAILSTIPLGQVLPAARLYTETVRIVAGGEIAGPMTIIYNGVLGDKWYRASDIFGHASVEYPAGPSFHGTAEVKKPLRAEHVEIPNPKLSLLGRYGKWQKGVLVDDAYREALDICRALR